MTTHILRLRNGLLLFGVLVYHIMHYFGGFIRKVYHYLLVVVYPVIKVSGKVFINAIYHRHAQP